MARLMQSHFFDYFYFNAEMGDKLISPPVFDTPHLQLLDYDS